MRETQDWNVTYLEYPDSTKWIFHKRQVKAGEEQEDIPESLKYFLKIFKSKFTDDDREQEQKDRCEYVSKARSINSIYDYARGNKWDYFGTFTVDRSKYDASNYTVVSKVLLKYLNNLRSRAAPNLKYLIVPELHKDGINYHFHALLANMGTVPLTDSGKIINGHKIYYLKCPLGFTSLSMVGDNGRVSNYICKYITKELYNHIKGKQRFFVSRNCDRPQTRKILLPWSEIEEIQNKLLNSADYIKTINSPYNGDTITYIEINKKDAPGRVDRSP